MAKLSSDAVFDPIRLADTRLLVQANSGGGKSWALRLICEQSAPILPIIILDWEDEFHTLREKFDLVLARENGDVPVELRSAGLLARKLIDLNLSAVINLEGLAVTMRRRYCKLFLESLLSAAKRRPASRLVVVDEAQTLCPQSEKSESTEAVVALCSQGRKRGLGAVLATQRLSRLSNDAAFECRNNLIGLTNFSADQKRVAEMMGLTTAAEKRELSQFGEGQFYCWGPAFEHNGVRLITTDRVQTTHLDARTRQSATPANPSKKIKGVLGEFADLAAKADAEVEDIKAAKSQIAQLKRDLAKKSGGPPNQAVIDAAVDRAIAERDRMWNAEVAKLKSQSLGFVDRLNKIEKLAHLNGEANVAPVIPKADPRRPRPSSPVVARQVEPQTDLPKGEAAILAACVQHGSCTRKQLSILTGYKRSTRDAYIQRLGEKGFVEASAGSVSPTDAGVTALGPDFERLPVGLDLQEYWLNRLPDGERRVLEVLIENYPNAVDRDELSDQTGYKRSTRDAYIQRLNARELVRPGRGDVQAAGTLFD